jgi:hypothetical protein
MKQTFSRAEREADYRRRTRARIAQLREAVRELRASGTQRVRAIHDECHAHQRALREESEALRARLRELVGARKATRGTCKARKDAARSERAQDVARALEALASERKNVRLLRVWARPATCSIPARVQAHERRQESDCEVLSNLDDADLRTVFQRISRSIRGSARRTRTEAFLEWVHDHSADVARIIEREHERAIRELEREERKQRALLSPGRAERLSDAALAAYLADVPF